MALNNVVLRRLVVMGFIGLAACTGGRSEPSDDRRSSGSMDRQNEICDPPGGPMPDAAVLGRWFAQDARAHRTTFGMQPPDSSTVNVVGDSVIAQRVGDALDIALSNKSTKSVNSPRHREKVYKAGGLYAVVDLDQEFCGADDIFLPIVYFVDSGWRYLGARSK